MRNTGRSGKGRKAAALAMFVLMFGAGLLFFYFRIYKVVPAFSEITCEYGDQISHNIEDYISGTDWSVHLGELDLSQVDLSRTGTYQAVVYHGRSQFTYEVIIQDTVAPEILWKEGQIYLAAGADYVVEDIIEGVADVDPKAEAFFSRNGFPESSLCFDSVGEYEVEILARDGSGNEAGGQVSVIVDTAPSFDGIHNFYCIPGSEPDYLEAVTAQDELDGDLTAEIRVDDSEVDLSAPGDYLLHYVAEDSYGLETVEDARVLVAEEDEIQEFGAGGYR